MQRSAFVRAVSGRPGGRLSRSSPELLEDLGFTHCSPAGIGTASSMAWSSCLSRGGRAMLTTICHASALSGRPSRGSEEPLSPIGSADFEHGAAEHHPGWWAPYTAIPSVFGGSGRQIPDHARVLEELCGLIVDHVVWCAPHRDVASWIRRHPEDFGNGVELDLSEA